MLAYLVCSKSMRMMFSVHTGAALLARRGPPSLNAVESALDAYAAEIAALRRDGLTRSLPSDEAERFFALGFALEQMHLNLFGRATFRDIPCDS